MSDSSNLGFAVTASLLDVLLASAAEGPDGKRSVRVTGRVVSCSDPFFTGDDERPAFEITIQPLYDHGDLQTLPFHDPETYKLAMEAMRHGYHVQASGNLEIPRQKKKKGRSGGKDSARLELTGLCEVETQTERLAPPQHVIDQADRIIDELARTPGAIKDYLIDQGHKHEGTVTSSRSPRYRQFEHAVLLQALSYGQVLPSVNPRLGILAVSRPGAGKKFTSKLALLYAVAGQLIQPSMISMPGVGAAVHKKKGCYTAEPGALPKCNFGTAVLEDFHRVDPKVVKAVHACLLGVAEDGQTVQTKVSTAAYQSCTALHINSNMTSVINAALRDPSIRGKLKEMGIGYDLLSRIDVIIELTAGDNATQQAEEMVVQDIPRETRERRAEKTEQELLLKTLVARLIDRFAEVSFKQVEPELRQLVRDISLTIGHVSARMTEEQQQLFDGEGLLRRMANSIRKLVSANARLNARNYATNEDVEVAWDMLSYKLEVVRWICDPTALRVRTMRSREQVVAQAREVANNRWVEMLRRFGGEELPLQDVAADLGVSVRTVGRDLEGHGYYPEWGTCSFPTLLEEAERVSKGDQVKQPPPGYSDEHYQLPDEGVSAQQVAQQVEDPGPPIKLEPAGPDLLRVLEGMRGDKMRDQQHLLAEDLLEIGFAYKPCEKGSVLRAGQFCFQLDRQLSCTIENSKIVKGLRERLNAPDPVPRGRLVLQLLVGSGWKTRVRELREILSKPDLPAVLRDPIESILAREEWKERKREEQRQRDREEERRRREREVLG